MFFRSLPGMQRSASAIIRFSAREAPNRARSTLDSLPTAEPAAEHIALFIPPEEDHRAKKPTLDPASKRERRDLNWLKQAGMFLLAIAGILSGAASLNSMQYVNRSGIKLLPVSHPNDLPYPEPARISGWPTRVELLASSSQNHYSYYSERGGTYINALMDMVQRNETHALGQSHAQIWVQGYPIEDKRQLPVSSADVADSWCLNAWDKRDNMRKQRFALLLEGGPDFRGDCQRWREMLRNEFSVPGDHMVYYPRSHAADVAKGLRQICRLIEESRLDPNDVEVMVYYSGHGRAFQLKNSPPTRDGEALGAIALRERYYWEDELRQDLETHLPDIPTTVILNACQSGAWIA